jgi:hypothetical protein
MNQDNQDLRYIGDQQPTANGSVGVNVSYKGFSMNVGFNLRWGGWVHNWTEMNKGENANLAYNLDRRFIGNSWMKPGDHALYKDKTGNSNAPTYPNDMFIHKESVLNCTNINLQYTFADRLLRGTGLRALSLNVSLSDIFYLSNVKRERGTGYPYAINPNFGISCSF